MASSEPFTFIETSKDGTPALFPTFHDLTAGRIADLDVQIVTKLREQHPDLIVTSIPMANVPLLAFAAAGFATAELDTATEPIISWRGFIPPSRRGGAASLGQSTSFAKYHYKWNKEDYILYTCAATRVQYVLKEPRGNETTLSPSAVTDALIFTIGQWLMADEQVIYVFDGYWKQSKALWREVQKASWDKVILDDKMKKALKEVSGKFFDSKDVYDDYGVPWKRGLIFHGPVGNGKTISIKALMRTLYDREKPIPTLYVKSAPSTYAIRNVFQFARSMSPCMLVLEDIETIVTPATRSYFFNEVDGLENNDGILMVASTNYLERLDPGLSKRPSRFDRKYLFPLPNKEERMQFCEMWRERLESKPAIDFPKKLIPYIADISVDFSFAYLQEAFVATLLVLVRDSAEEPGTLRTSDTRLERAVRDLKMDDEKDGEGDDKDPDGLDEYIFWRTIKYQIHLLREDMNEKMASESSRLRFDKADSHVSREAPGGLADSARQGHTVSLPVLHSSGPAAAELSLLPSSFDRGQALYSLGRTKEFNESVFEYKANRSS